MCSSIYIQKSQLVEIFINLYPILFSDVVIFFSLTTLLLSLSLFVHQHQQSVKYIAYLPTFIVKYLHVGIKNIVITILF